jgi:hypothetical protein
MNREWLASTTRTFGLIAVLVLAFPPALRCQSDTAGARISDSLNTASWMAFRDAVIRGDTASVASKVCFPLRVNGSGHEVGVVQDSLQFRGEYGRVLPPRLQALIARLPPESLWTSLRGTATPGGELWFEGACLVAINLPASR